MARPHACARAVACPQASVRGGAVHTRVQACTRVHTRAVTYAYASTRKDKRVLHTVHTHTSTRVSARVQACLKTIAHAQVSVHRSGAHTCELARRPSRPR